MELNNLRKNKKKIREKDNVDTGMHTEYVNFHKVNTGVYGVSITQVRS